MACFELVKGYKGNISQWNISNTSYCLISFVKNICNALYKVLFQDLTLRSSCVKKTSKDDEDCSLK